MSTHVPESRKGRSRDGTHRGGPQSSEHGSGPQALCSPHPSDAALNTCVHYFSESQQPYGVATLVIPLHRGGS